MATYLHPGVYIEEIPSGAKPIEGVSTSVAALIGYTTKGAIGTPTLVHSWDEYKAEFGEITSETDTLALAAFYFFLNGGRDAYIGRLAKDTKAASLAAGNIQGRGAASATDVLEVRAANQGGSGNSLKVQAEAASDGYRFSLKVFSGVDPVEAFSGLSMDPTDASYALAQVNSNSQYIRLALPAGLNGFFKQATSVSGDLSTLSWAGVVAGMTLTLNIDNLGARTITLGEPDGGSYDGTKVAEEIEQQVLALGPEYVGFSSSFAADTLTLTSGKSSASSMVSVRPGALATTLKLGGTSVLEKHGSEDVVPAGMASAVSLTGGDDGVAPGLEDYHDFFAKMKKVRDVNIVLLPGQYQPADGTGNPIIDAAESHCTAMGSRMLLVDPPPATELDQGATVDALNLPTSTYSVLYYPWVKVKNPFYSRESNPTAAPTLTLAPSAFAAGIWARTDGTRGVWKAPAGVEASVSGVAALEYVVEDGDQDQLNPLGVNCLRKMPGYGHVIWGTRTLATNVNPEWRYVPVRRTALYIESSVRNGIQWAVFEPNDHRLWSSLRANIGAFMDGMFRAGAFQGQKSSDAYFVRCGIGDTMTQDDIDRGQVIAVVGFAPLKPAEFVIVRIQQKVGQS
ncbi:MAG: phage tail sheath subtilisin-like domain-containing protein [Desulfobulbus sp.]|nr:phage tail sheath subtilisin-like domain-containing protein [Desulfobulbus sp.]